MPTFEGNPFSNYFKRIYQTNQTSNTGIDATTRNMQTGDGVNTSISLSDDVLQVQPQTDDTTGTMLVKNQGGDNILAVDSTNKKVLVNEGQVAANTQYAVFGVNYIDFSNAASGTHMAIPFAMGGGSTTNDVPFGTGTDPATSFTTANTNMQLAAQLNPMIWMLQDNITISAVTCLVGADDATGDTHRIHLMSYDFTSGSTSCLTNGAVLAASGSDTVNAGNEQIYKEDLTIASADVNSGKAILAMFRSDSINSDFSITVNVKYFIR